MPLLPPVICPETSNETFAVYDDMGWCIVGEWSISKQVNNKYNNIHTYREEPTCPLNRFLGAFIHMFCPCPEHLMTTLFGDGVKPIIPLLRG